MKKTRVVTEEKRVEQTVDVLCNLCGRSCCTGNTSDHIDPKTQVVTPGEPVNNTYDGLIEAEVHGGFDSKRLGDMTSYKFSLCEDCLVEMFEKFKIPVEIRDDNKTSQFMSSEEYGDIKKARENVDQWGKQSKK